MARYLVHMAQVVHATKEVEAPDPDGAIEKAFLEGLPHLMFGDHTYPDEGEWCSPSELFPDINRPEDDYTLLEGA